MADGQKAAVETFVGQRLAGAAVFASFPAVRGVVKPAESETDEGNHLRSVLEVGRVGWKSRSIAILGADLRPRVQVGEELSADLGALLSPGRPDASRAGLVGSDGGTRLVVAAAIRGDGAGGPLGWVLLVEDPASILWPILSHDTSASRTGESCLVGRDRGAIVFLSPLRHLRENERPTVTALRADALAGRQALEGPEAFGEFRDYRGERVLAAVRRIDGPGWGLVVKIDRSEALSGLAGERALHALTLASFGLALFVVLRSFRASERHRAATELQRRDERHRKVLAQVRDAVIWVRPGDGRILEANRASEELWGYSHEELLQKTVAELRPEGEVEEIRTQTVESRSGGVLFFARQRRKDGLVFPVEVSARTVVLDGEDVLVSVVRDVSENEAVLHRIRLLNRLLRTINAVNSDPRRRGRPRDRPSPDVRGDRRHGRLRGRLVRRAGRRGTPRPGGVRRAYGGLLRRGDDPPRGRAPRTGTDRYGLPGGTDRRRSRLGDRPAHGAVARGGTEAGLPLERRLPGPVHRGDLRRPLALRLSAGRLRARVDPPSRRARA